MRGKEEKVHLLIQMKIAVVWMILFLWSRITYWFCKYQVMSTLQIRYETMSAEPTTDIERVFSSLPSEEQETIIRHGVALRTSDLKKRLFLAQSKVQQFEKQYGATLESLETSGLPDDASWEMHEDYIMWRHWTSVAQKTTHDINSLRRGNGNYTSSR